MPISSYLCGISLVIALSACGGGGGRDPEPAASPAPPSVDPFTGTAYLKTRRTILHSGKSYGPARSVSQGLVDQCNFFRDVYYKLPAISPPEDVMASLDVNVEERYLDSDKALTITTRSHIDIPDSERWFSDLGISATGEPPAVPLDCAVRRSEYKTGTLWRDGIVYELRFETAKAIGTRRSGTLPPPMTNDEFLALPSNSYLGQTCREVTPAEPLFAGEHACMWDLFPYVAHLNWPFALSGSLRFGIGDGFVETIETLAIEHGMAIAPSVFEIPAGLSVTILE